MYEGVPIHMPIVVRLDVSTRAMPKSATLSVPLGVENQVGRLDVAMNDAALVRKIERLQQLGHDGDDLRQVEGRATVQVVAATLCRRRIPSR